MEIWGLTNIAKQNEGLKQNSKTLLEESANILEIWYLHPLTL